MSRFTVTPWRTQADLLQVREQLYRLDSDSPDVRRYAVDRVMAWKFRGNLPHAVESTALLVDAILHHRHEDSSSTNSIFSVRAVYSAAFARFVTGFCDIGRSKERSLEPSSMLEIARQIDMPPEFVALRHEATHEELPALQRLVHATEEALRWLWNAYWSRLGESEMYEDAEATLSLVRSDARRILRNYRSTRRDAIRAGKHQRPDQDALTGETSKACMEICNGNVEKTNALTDVLVEDKLLSPSRRELGSSLEGAFLLWDSLLQRMWTEQLHISTAIVRRLLQAISKGSAHQPERDAEREAYCRWLRHFVDDDVWQSFLSSSESSYLRKNMMRWCCVYPGYWCQFLGGKLLETGGKDFKADWEDIFGASCLELPDGGGSGPDRQDPNPAGKGKDMDNRFSTGKSSRVASLSQGNSSEDSSWTRTVMPLHVPIGIVP